ncbi:MAG TPA: hypothetical protein VEX38_01610 [Fimbriimonadaceae bacterium]|nr:hypothetical protein [Fimbriimonadaceae bacterium]
MRRAGRASLVSILVIVCLLGVISLLFLPKDSAASTASQFMSALAAGDAEALTELSYMGSSTKEQIRPKWEYVVKVAAPYYRFVWQIEGVTKITETEAGARLAMYQGQTKARPGTEERYTLPLIKIDGKWLVDVRSINPKMFPALPR